VPQSAGFGGRTRAVAAASEASAASSVSASYSAPSRSASTAGPCNFLTQFLLFLLFPPLFLLPLSLPLPLPPLLQLPLLPLPLRPKPLCVSGPCGPKVKRWVAGSLRLSIVDLVVSKGLSSSSIIDLVASIERKPRYRPRFKVQMNAGFSTTARALVFSLALSIKPARERETTQAIGQQHTSPYCSPL